MARRRDRGESDSTPSSRQVSSDEMLKRAWDDLGQSPSGERRVQDDTSASGEMAAAARAGTFASDSEMAAEDIARALREEAAPQSAPAAVRREAPPLRPAMPPPRSGPRRPRRDGLSTLPPPETAGAPHRPERPQQSVPERPARRRGRNIGWLIFAAILVINGVVGSFFEDSSNGSGGGAERAPATTVPAGASRATIEDVQAVEPGTCILNLPSIVVSRVATVPCSMPHQYEVFAQARLPDSPYPGAQEANRMGTQACQAEFPAYVGERREDSAWHIAVLPPSAEDWGDTGGGVATCLLFQSGGGEPEYTEGSARNSGGPSA